MAAAVWHGEGCVGNCIESGACAVQHRGRCNRFGTPKLNPGVCNCNQPKAHPAGDFEQRLRSQRHAFCPAQSLTSLPCPPPHLTVLERDLCQLQVAKRGVHAGGIVQRRQPLLPRGRGAQRLLPQAQSAHAVTAVVLGAPRAQQLLRLRRAGWQGVCGRASAAGSRGHGATTTGAKGCMLNTLPRPPSPPLMRDMAPVGGAALQEECRGG